MMSTVNKPGIDQLLIASAMEPELRRRLADSPDDVFQDYELTEEEKDILRWPDQRLLGLLGAALSRQGESSAARAETPAPKAAVAGRMLPDFTLALTAVPCAVDEAGQAANYKYAVWVAPLPEGADPASLPPPPGTVLPGRALAPLYAVIQVSAVEVKDEAGNARVGLTASLRQSTNMVGPAPPEAAGKPGAPPFGSDLASAEVRAAVAAVRKAPAGERYDRLIDLAHVLRSGEVV